MFSTLTQFLEARFSSRDEGLRDDAEQLRTSVAALLVEMARADFEEDGEELEHARHLLTDRYGLDESEAERLLEAARAEADRTVSLFRFTHLINQHLEMPDKVELMEMLWEVAYADGRLDKHEDALMHKLGDLLYVPLKDLMGTKERVRKKKRETKHAGG